MEATTLTKPNNVLLLNLFVQLSYCRILYIRWELIFAYFAVPYMREIKDPRKNKPNTLFRT